MSSGKMALLRPSRGSLEAIVRIRREGGGWGGGDGSSVSLFSMVQIGKQWHRNASVT